MSDIIKQFMDEEGDRRRIMRDIVGPVELTSVTAALAEAAGTATISAALADLQGNSITSALANAANEVSMSVTAASAAANASKELRLGGSASLTTALAGELDTFRIASGLDALNGPDIARVFEPDTINNAAYHALIGTRFSSDIDRQLSELTGMTSATADAVASVNSAVQAAYDSMFREPSLAETLEMFGGNSTIAESVAATAAAEIANAVSGINQPWARIGSEAQSASSIAVLMNMADGALRHPFEPDTIDLFRSGFGDWRNTNLPSLADMLEPVTRTAFYRRSGFDPSLVDFPTRTLDAILDRALIDPLPDSEAEVGDQETDEELSVETYRQLRRFERDFRNFLITSLEKHCGSKWLKQRVPGDMRNRWQDDREKELAKGQKERPHLIDYSNFGDLIQLVENRANWNDIFKSIFHRVEDVRESFMRLIPVRNAVAHSGIITIDDETIMRYEVTRITKAIHKSGLF